MHLEFGSDLYNKIHTTSLLHLLSNDPPSPSDADIISGCSLSSGQADLIRDVVNGLQILKSKVSVVVPHGESDGLKSRLNSQLYLYEIDGDSIKLHESYQIR